MHTDQFPAYNWKLITVEKMNKETHERQFAERPDYFQTNTYDIIK